MNQSMNEEGELAASRKRDIGREIYDDIIHMITRRNAPAGTWRAHVEDVAKRGGARVWNTLKKHPSIGVVVFGGLTMTAASAVGVGEMVLGITIGYAAWQGLRKGKTIDEALGEVQRFAKI